jgi:hypothetical protein
VRVKGDARTHRFLGTKRFINVVATGLWPVRLDALSH